MEIYTPKTKIKLSPVIRNGREFVEVTFGNDNDIRLSLSKEENVLLVGGRAYLPAEDFVLAEFFDRYVKMAFIDYSAIKETAPRKEEDKRPPLPEGYLEKPGIYTPVTPRRVVLPAGRMGNIAANTVWGNNYLQGYCERNRTAAGKANHVGAGHRRCRRAQSDQHYHPLP